MHAVYLRCMININMHDSKAASKEYFRQSLQVFPSSRSPRDGNCMGATRSSRSVEGFRNMAGGFPLDRCQRLGSGQEVGNKHTYIQFIYIYTTLYLYRCIYIYLQCIYNPYIYILVWMQTQCIDQTVHKDNCGCIYRCMYPYRHRYSFLCMKDICAHVNKCKHIHLFLIQLIYTHYHLTSAEMTR